MSLLRRKINFVLLPVVGLFGEAEPLPILGMVKTEITPQLPQL